MITNNVIHRVFKFKYRDNVGTCFIIDINDYQYFVTAKHVLEIRDNQDVVQSRLTIGENIELFRENKWNSIPIINVKHSNESDVSVFAIEQKIGAHPLPATMGGITYGQDIYFLGFPYEISSDIGELNRLFPLPFVRKGILSATYLDQPGKPFLIDGHNNPGFSGGPVIFKEANSSDFKVAGVIHGYNPEYKIENGQLIPIENTNSGIVIAYSISNALELIKEMTESI